MPEMGKDCCFGQWKGVALTEKKKRLMFWSMERGCIARNGGKIDILVNGKGVHCSKRRID